MSVEINKIVKSPVLYLFIVLITIIVTGYCMGWHQFITPKKIQAFVLSFGVFAPLIFIVLFALTPFAPFFSAVLALASGLIFGFVYGSILIMVGATCSSTVGFYLARYFDDWLKKRRENQTQQLGRLAQSFDKNGFVIILILRLLPIAPFDLISYAAGFSRIRYKDYIIATFLGMFPGVLIYANIGDNTLDIHSRGFYISIALLVILTLLVVGVKKSIQKKYSITEY